MLFFDEQWLVHHEYVTEVQMLNRHFYKEGHIRYNQWLFLGE